MNVDVKRKIVENHVPLIAAFAVNLTIIAVCFLFRGIYFSGATDDYFMARILEGVFGESYNVHTVFVNVLYGYALLPLYHLFPKVGWYYVGEIVAVFLSFTTVSYVIIKKAGLRWGTIISFLLVACFARDFYLTVQFTQCAAALGGAGMLLFVYCLDCSFERKGMVFLSIFLMVWGYCMRSDAFLMGLPFFGWISVFFFKKVVTNKWKMVLWMAIILTGIMGAKFFNDCHYANEEYQSFTTFQPTRVMLGDKLNYDAAAVYDEIEEDGLFVEDYFLLRYWNFYDTDIFSIDSLSRITNKIAKYTPPVKFFDLPHKVLYRFDKSICYPCCWAFILMGLILVRFAGKKSLYTWGSLVLVFAVMGYLIYLLRLIYRVETGLWFYATVLAIPLLKINRSFSRRRFIFCLSFCMLAYIVCCACTGSWIRSISSGNLIDISNKKAHSADCKPVFDYMNTLPMNTVFLVPMTMYWSFADYRGPLYYSEPIGSWKRIISLGFWTPYFPDVEKNLKNSGISNPMKDVVKENAMVIAKNEFLLDFLHRHYYKNAKVDTVKNIDGIMFLKYSKGME